MKIKKGDTVVVITGKDRGRKGEVMHSLPEKGKVVVEKINLMKKHVRPKKEGEKGQVVEFPSPINVSNVKLVCPKCNKATRVGIDRKGGKRIRVCKECKKTFA